MKTGESLVKFFGSNNSRYFAVKLAGEVRLYRGITAGDGTALPNEAGFLWSRQMDDNVPGGIIHIGNQGDIFFLSPRGLFRMRLDRAANFDTIGPVCAVARSEDSQQLGRVSVDADGRQVLFETITPEAGLKGKLFRLLGSKGQANPSAIVHLIHPYSISTNTQDLPFPGGTLDAKKGGELLWSASPCFRYLVIARPEKKSYLVQVVDVLDKSILFDFTMPIATLAGAWVNEQGVAMLDVRQLGSEQLVIAKREGDKIKRYGFEPPPTYEVAHLGKNYVALKVRTPPRLCIYNFDGSAIADVDVRPLASMGVTFDFSFNERDDIDVLTWHQGSLFVHHSDPKSIVFDAKRWELTARHTQYEIEEQMVHEATSAHREELRRLDRLDATQRLAASVMSELEPLPDSSLLYEEAMPELPRPSPMRQLEIEPMKATVEVPLDPIPEFEPPLPPPVVPQRLELTPPPPPPVRRQEAPPSLPPRFEPPSPSIAPSLPSINKVQKGIESAPRSAEAAPQRLQRPGAAPVPSAGQTRRPPPAPEPLDDEDLTPPPPPPGRAESIPSFLRGGAMMPPPQTEEEDFVTPSAEIPPPPPPPVPVAVPSGANLTDIEAELDRLRMRYVAGEMAREEYYARRTELEAQKKQLQSQPTGGPTRSAPRRLDLSLDDSGTLSLPSAPPTGTPGRKLNLGSSLNLDDSM